MTRPAVPLAASSQCHPSRVRVDGKFFAHGARRLRLQGVTYGPFAPDHDGEQFPPPQRVRDDFRRMRDAGAEIV